MPVVSNTSPILNLAIIGRLALLRQQFPEIHIPPAVLDELRIEADLPGSQAVREGLEQGWLKVAEVKDRPFVHLLQREVDHGEAEAIALAIQLQAEWTLLDEREGRCLAKGLGLRVTGVLGILLRAHSEGQCPSLLEVVKDLREKAGFHIAPDLLSHLLQNAEDDESRSPEMPSL